MSKDPTREEIELFLAQEDQRLEAQRKAENLKQANEPLKEKMEKYLREHGGTDKTCRRLGFVLAFVPKKMPPQWKEEFLKVTSVEEVNRISNQKRMKDSLVVTREAA